MADTLVDTALEAALASLAQTWVVDPMRADLELNNLVFAKTGDLERTPSSYYENCGSGFLRKQTCEHRAKIRRETLQKRQDFYTKKYLPIRAAYLASMAAALQKSKPTQEQFKTGQDSLIFKVTEQQKKLTNRDKWTGILRTGVAFVPVLGQFAAVGLGIMETFLVNNGTDVQEYQWNRFQEVPPEVEDNKGLFDKNFFDWENIHLIRLITTVAEEHLQTYYVLFPDEKPKISAPTPPKVQTANLPVVGWVLMGLLVLGAVYKRYY